MPGTAEDQTFRFLLLGKTGSGKSSTGNTILGQDLFDSEVSFVAVTDQCQLKSATRNGAKIEIIDCPGLFDPRKKHDEVAALIMEAFAISPSGGFDVICYIIEIGCYTDEELAVFNRLKALLDADFPRHLLVVFTHGDRLKGKRVLDVLQQAPGSPIHNVLSTCDNRHVVFDNSSSSDNRQEQEDPQVSALLEEAGKMKAANGSSLYQGPRYAADAGSLNGEVARRMEEVERAEASRKKFTQNLDSRLAETQNRASSQREEGARRTQEGEEAARANERSLQERVDSATAALVQTEQSVRGEAARAEAMRQQLQQEQAQHAAELEAKRQEIAALR